MLEKVLIAYYAVSIVYFVICMKWKLTDPLFNAMLLLFLPILGLILSLLQLIAARRSSLDPHRFTDLIDGYSDQEDRIFERVDVEKEVNLVPLEEALVVNDLTTRRRLLLDLLKEDMDESVIPLLEKAISNDDTETSHYAVTAVMEIKRKLLLSIQKWSVKYEDNKNDSAVILQYAFVVKQYMTSGFMDKRMQLTYRMTYINLLDQLLESDARNEAMFIEKINNEVELGHFDEAMQASLLFRKCYPDTEDAYLAALNMFYILKMKEQFFETLQELKQSKIRISNTTLNIIRYWSAKGA